MNIKLIRTNKDYKEAMERMEKLWGAKNGTPAGDELEVLATLIDKYEEEHFPIDATNEKGAIKRK